MTFNTNCAPPSSRVRNLITVLYCYLAFTALSLVFASTSGTQTNVVTGKSSGGTGGWFGNILGKNKGEIEAIDVQTSRNGGQRTSYPPPPPLPPTDGTGQQLHPYPPPPPPPPQSDIALDQQESNGSLLVNKYEPPASMTEAGDVATSSPPLDEPQTNNGAFSPIKRQTYSSHPPIYQDWHMQRSPPNQQHNHQQPHPTTSAEAALHSLQLDFDAALSQQNQMFGQIQNLTSTIYEMEHQSEIQLTQIDILTTQVADAEAHASAESNAALEYRANCSSLGEIIEKLKIEASEWEDKCNGLQREQDCNSDQIKSLKQKLNDCEMELEEMACGIEMERVQGEKKRYAEALERKRSQCNGGLFGWLFGWMTPEGDEDSDDELERLQAAARSTLLNALQTERNNVHELEASLYTAQQNNSAIAEMVSSRDSLIDELNNRVAVFEEDKMVLKAALRQLQREMKEEAPKAKKLETDLKSTKDEVGRLLHEIEELKEIHDSEINSINSILAEKNNMINETDSKMSMISVYVDQLEERLTSFAIARRDIASREEKCDEMEKDYLKKEDDYRQSLRQLNEVIEERDELKNLSSLLVEERAVLQEEKKILEDEKRMLREECLQAKNKITSLSNQLQEMQLVSEDFTQRLETAEFKTARDEEKIEALEDMLHQAQIELNEQSTTIQTSTKAQDSLTKDIESLEQELEMLKNEQNHVIERLDVAQNENDVLIKKLKAEKMSKEKEMNFKCGIEECSTRPESDRFGIVAEGALATSEKQCNTTQYPPPCHGMNGTVCIMAESEVLTKDDVYGDFGSPDNSIKLDSESGLIEVSPKLTEVDALREEYENNRNEDGTSSLTTNEDTSDCEQIDTESDENIHVNSVDALDDKQNEPNLPQPQTQDSMIDIPSKAFIPRSTVPFRRIRKACSKYTGIRGFFSEKVI